MSAAPDPIIRVGRHQGTGKTRANTLLALQAAAGDQELIDAPAPVPDGPRGPWRMDVRSDRAADDSTAVSPSMAAWMVTAGLAIAYVDEATGTQQLFVPKAATSSTARTTTRRTRRKGAHA